MSSEQDQQEYFHISEWNIGRLREKIARMNVRAAKIGCPEIEMEIVGQFQCPAPGYEEQAEVMGNDWVPQITIYKVDIKGEGPKIAGWKFVGTLDHVTLPGSVIVNSVPGERVPQEFHNHDAVCDHCGRIRRRNETFVLEHEEGGHKQVGRQCLRDFLGHDPRAVARFLTGLFKFVSGLEDEEWFGGSGGPRYECFNHDAVLQATISVIRENGWVPRSAANPSDGRAATADIVLNVFIPPMHQTREDRIARDHWLKRLDIHNEKNVEEAKAAREWLRQQEANNEYMHNLQMIDEANAVPTRMFGYWCSLVAAYQRAQERLRLNKAQKKTNEYFGEIKQRTELVVKVISIRYIDGAFGAVGLVKMHDEKGRTAVWFANTSVDMDEGYKYKIKGTIKKHKEYDGWKQTVLSRVKVLEEVEEDEKSAA